MPRALSYPALYYPVFLLALVLVFLSARAVVVPSFELQPLPVNDYSVRRCAMAGADGTRVLRLLDAVYLEGSVLFHRWCESPAFAAHFGALESRSVHRDYFNLRELHESRYDLVLAKPELIEGAVVAGAGVPYRMIAQYRAYGSQLVALSGKPELTREWLVGRTIGLLDDPNSVSAYQVPISALRERGLMDVADITYFRSYREMYRALFAHRVDAIASIVSDEGPQSELQVPDGLVLAENLPGPAWFASRELIDSAAYCTVIEGIARFGEETRVDFFRDIRVEVPCGE